ncbi:glycoside hydrolase family 125 protein [Prolixibacter sp. NT017]|uniref:glycoside hydrolase family 125 protein n=1 Tax=Prolixibacter sp. NT017 TaxID=2652390 RepID=UPI00127702CB|nr:glycoside hydrolase family 125 protein [Prolixibacter sp. NT017]GET24011.1 meiotically up-regulated protein [Prolixibacter sp. NT017]
MTTRRNFIRTGTLTTAGLTISGLNVVKGKKQMTAFRSKRPEPSKRNFTSQAVETAVRDTKAKIKDPKLAWMFENCYPNTLDTTVEFTKIDGRPDTFVITGDIHAMWLRDSSAQVWPYLPLVNQDSELKALLSGVINRQTQCILFDPYANAFNKDETEKSEWMSDLTDMKPGLHERKWEIDSLCYPVRLAWHYWQKTGDIHPFDEKWKKAAELIYKTFVTQQRKEGLGPYKFERETTRQLDTLSNNGHGRPLNPVGLINSAFRPSDDATTYGFLVPSNLFAVTSLKQMSDISEEIYGDKVFAEKCRALATEVEDAIQRYAIIEHPKYGKVFAYEVDGFGNATLMDDSNVPSLLALPYLGCVESDNETYQNTRELVWSEDNPYFFKGKAAEGIGGPHIGYDMVWPMSIIMRAMTSTDDREISWCVKTLRDTDAGTGFMHEAFHKDNPMTFTRSWFAWANTLFGELILKLVNEGKMKCLE